MEWRYYLVVFCAVVYGLDVCVQAAQVQQGSAPTRRSSLPHCGLYCVYAAVKIAGGDVDFQDLVRPKYIGSWDGSSLAELKMAVEDIGMHGAVVANLTTKELRAFQGGIVLHVKSTMKKPDYDHYILFLGTSNGKAKVLDPFELVKLVPFKELALRWDGTGLIISVRPISAISIFAIGIKHFLVFAGIAVACILLVRWAKYQLRASMQSHRRSLLKLSIVEVLGFLIVAFACGAIYHTLRDEGYLAYPDAVAAIQDVHLRNFIPKIGVNKARKLLDSDAIFVDARYASDYQAGHLEGAISLPVDANGLGHQEATFGIPKDARLVVYCQSSGCKFSEKVAIRLVRDGFSDVSIYKGGWAEWRAGEEE